MCILIDPNFVGYYDLDEAYKQELGDMGEIGYDSGIEKRKMEVAIAIYEDGVAITTISKYIGLTNEEVQNLLNFKN